MYTLVAVRVPRFPNFRVTAQLFLAALFHRRTTAPTDPSLAVSFTTYRCDSDWFSLVSCP
jgi:hypothetical protein